MSILKDVLSELFSMFVADARLTFAVLAVVALAALMISVTGLPALLGGAFLLVSCLAVLILSVKRESVKRESVKREGVRRESVK
jgi:membrane protein implicated in regulation of membrane protease activity